MKEAQPIFSIEDTALKATKQERRILPRFTLADRLSTALKTFHPILFEHLEYTAEESPQLSEGYAAGFGMLYDVLAHQMDESSLIEITKEDMALHNYNVQDLGIDKLTIDELHNGLDQSSTDGSTDNLTPVATFMNRLESSSPEMYSETREILSGAYLDDNEKVGYFRGIYDVFMPFYNKAEAGYLQDHLITYPYLKRAVESGFYNEE